MNSGVKGFFMLFSIFELIPSLLNDLEAINLS